MAIAVSIETGGFRRGRSVVVGGRGHDRGVGVETDTLPYADIERLRLSPIAPLPRRRDTGEVSHDAHPSRRRHRLRGRYLYAPVLTAQAQASDTEIRTASNAARYTGEFRRDLPGRDALHWAQGKLAVSDTAIAFSGDIAPGPDYWCERFSQFIGAAQYR
ncbi:hypothetical protein [Burkholderia sp. BE12]|uniref:hypothetical protein n=1 Tax=Burkholderia sp. BE12 TaxID=2082394 RepID=UPI003FA351EF